jgi:hypothetical protein
MAVKRWPVIARHGVKVDMPLLARAEIGFVIDEERLYVGTGAKNVGLLSDNNLGEGLAMDENGVVNVTRSSGLAFCLVNPPPDAQSARFILPNNRTAVKVVINTAPAPEAPIICQVIRGGAAIVNLSHSGVLTKQTLDPRVSLAEGDVLYGQIVGNANGVISCTIQLVVEG